ncbi:MAG: GAF domain-containing protein [Desulfatiglandaceae bacterium]
MKESFPDTAFFSLGRVIDLIYREEEQLSDILYFIISLAAEITGAVGSTLRVLEQGTFNLKVVSSYGLTKKYLHSGAIDYGKSVTEIMQGDVMIVNDFEHDSRIQNLEAAKREGVSAVIGIPFTVNDTTYAILRTYYAQKKVPSQDEMEFLYSLGKLSCLAIEREAVSELKASENLWRLSSV